MTPEEILTGAIEVLEKGGWQRDSFGDATSAEVPHCAVGALRVSFDWTHARYLADYEAYYEACRRLAQQVDPEFSSALSDIHIYSWNDDPNTTVEDVILAMKKAAYDEA